MVKKIVFDPGHRNTSADFGASGNGLREATVALEIVNQAVSYLNDNYSGHEIKLTRHSDTQIIDLNDRDDVSDNWGADVFVSVHLNAFNKSAFGFETYIYNGTVKEQTVRLQSIMHKEILNAMRKFGDINDRGEKRANYAVLRETNAPAILTENLFIDSPTDGRLLKDPNFIKAVGIAHAVGVAKFLGLPAKNTTVPKGEGKMFNPSSNAVKESAINVLESFTKAENGISKVWVDKLKNDQLTDSDMIGLLYVAIDRGLL